MTAQKLTPQIGPPPWDYQQPKKYHISGEFTSFFWGGGQCQIYAPQITALPCPPNAHKSLGEQGQPEWDTGPICGKRWGKLNRRSLHISNVIVMEVDGEAGQCWAGQPLRCGPRLESTAIYSKLKIQITWGTGCNVQDCTWHSLHRNCVTSRHLSHGINCNPRGIPPVLSPPHLPTVTPHYSPGHLVTGRGGGWSQNTHTQEKTLAQHRKFLEGLQKVFQNHVLGNYFSKNRQKNR